MKKTSVKIFSYGSEKHLNILGMFHTKLSGSVEDRTQMTAKLYVTEGSSGSLIGQNTAIEIGLLRIGLEPSLVNKVNKLKWIMTSYLLFQSQFNRFYQIMQRCLMELGS